MRILYLSQLLPYPPDAGAKVRSYYTLRYLAKRHKVTLLAFTRPDDTPAGLEHLQGFCEQVHSVPMLRSARRNAAALARSLANGRSFIIDRDFVPEMDRKIRELVGNQPGETARGIHGEPAFEAVHADQLWMAQYALRASRLAGGGGRLLRVLDEHNACFQIFQRLAEGEYNPIKRVLLEREWRRLRRYEGWACGQFDQVVTVTQEDRAILQGLVAENTDGAMAPARIGGSAGRGPRFSTIPICVDTQSVPPVKPERDASEVMYLGTMFWLPNVEGVLWFAQQVWPLVRAQAPNSSFTIIGKNPLPEVRALEDKDGQMGGIRVTGYVPDPTDYLQRAGVFIVPLSSGGGMRVKIIDAWRWGLPVVSTTIGAEGIEYRDGENILIADRAEDFAAAVTRVLADGSLAQRLRENGRRWVEQQYEWRRVYSAWDQVYESFSGMDTSGAARKTASG